RAAPLTGASPGGLPLRPAAAARGAARTPDRPRGHLAAPARPAPAVGAPGAAAPVPYRGPYPADGRGSAARGASDLFHPRAALRPAAFRDPLPPRGRRAAGIVPDSSG